MGSTTVIPVLWDACTGMLVVGSLVRAQIWNKQGGRTGKQSVTKYGEGPYSGRMEHRIRVKGDVSQTYAGHEGWAIFKAGSGWHVWLDNYPLAPLLFKREELEMAGDERRAP